MSTGVVRARRVLQVQNRGATRSPRNRYRAAELRTNAVSGDGSPGVVKTTYNRSADDCDSARGARSPDQPRSSTTPAGPSIERHQSLHLSAHAKQRSRQRRQREEPCLRHRPFGAVQLLSSVREEAPDVRARVQTSRP